MGHARSPPSDPTHDLALTRWCRDAAAHLYLLGVEPVVPAERDAVVRSDGHLGVRREAGLRAASASARSSRVQSQFAGLGRKTWPFRYVARLEARKKRGRSLAAGKKRVGTGQPGPSGLGSGRLGCWGLVEGVTLATSRMANRRSLSQNAEPGPACRWKLAACAHRASDSRPSIQG